VAHQVLLVRKERKAQLELQVLPAQLDLKEQLVQRERQDLPEVEVEHLDHKVQREQQVQLVRQELQVQRAQQERQVLREQLVPQEQREQPVQPDPLGFLILQLCRLTTSRLAQ
jgi:hypothetical protein